MLKRISLEKYWKQLQEIKEAQAKKDFLPFLFITVEPDGAITIGVGADQRRFETLFDMEAYLVGVPGVTLETTVTIEDFQTVPNGRYLPGGDFEPGPYLPADPIWYYCDQAERKRFIDLAQSDDYAPWMELYMALITSLQARSISEPGMLLPGFDDPAVKDLLENHQRFTPAELVERYQDRRWFLG